MHILGLDPGLNTTGYAVLECLPGRKAVAEAGVIRSEAKGGTAARLKVLYDGVVEVLDQWKPAALAVEQLYAHYDHPRTAILMAHARGCYFLAGAQAGLPVVSYPSTRVKKLVTGHGRATKEQMQYAVMRELGLAKLPEPHDVADALAIALCHAHAVGLGDAAGIVSKGVNLEAMFEDGEE
jgi:crossover junction endodeoxyribonuclease RuvC